VALSRSGIAHGYGFQVALLSDTVPRHAVVAFTDPGTPAAANGIGRGAVILAVDGLDVVNSTEKAALNAALFPTEPGTHTFTIQDLGSATPRTVTLTAQALASAPVRNVKTLPAPNAHVGYLLFNDHVATSEAQLVAAFEQLRGAGRQRAGTRRSLQRRRLPRHCRRAGLHDRRAGADRRQGVRAPALQRPQSLQPLGRGELDAVPRPHAGLLGPGRPQPAQP
jgi:hypothetical protein